MLSASCISRQLICSHNWFLAKITEIGRVKMIRTYVVTSKFGESLSFFRDSQDCKDGETRSWVAPIGSRFLLPAEKNMQSDLCDETLTQQSVRER